MGKGLLTEAEMTQRLLHHQKPLQYELTAHESWKSRARCTASRQLDRLEGLPVSSTCLRMSLKQSQICLGKEEPSTSAQFQGFPIAFEFKPPELKEPS